MHDFACVWHPNAARKSIDDGQEAGAGTFRRRRQHNYHVAVRIDVHGMVDAVVDFATANELFAAADEYFDGQKFDQLVEDVKRRVEDQILFFFKNR